MRVSVYAMILAGLCLLGGAAQSQAQAQVAAIKLGVLNDQSGLYTDLSGPGGVDAVKMAVEDFGNAIPGAKIEVITADHQNKPDIGSSIAQQWFDQDHVDALFDVPSSGVALAVQEVARKSGKIAIFSGPATSDLTGAKCSPTGFHWTYDTYALAKGTGAAITKSGGDTWFFLTADYAFG